MADNTELPAGSGGDTIATDDIAGVKYQRVKVTWGPDGTANDTDDASGKQLPVKLADLNGAATAAKQPALGTAGTASTDVISVQGIASMTALKVDGSAAAQPVTDNGTTLSVDDGGAALTVDGTVDVGTVTTVTTVAAVTAISNALPAGTNLLGRVAASDESSTIYNGTTALTPKFAAIDAASSGDNTILAAVTSKKIRVVSLFVVSAGTTTVRFESGASGTALTGQMNLIANTGFVLPYNPAGWFETASGTLLNMELSAAVSVDGSFSYVEV